MTRVENIQKEGNTKKAGRHTHTYTQLVFNVCNSGSGSSSGSR